MQKAIVIQTRGSNDYSSNLNADELNRHLADGWRFISACPFGCAVAEGGETATGASFAAILVIIERPR